MKRLVAAVLAVIVFLSCGGSQKVLVPPRIDLKPYGTIGMIQLESNAKGNLADYTSQRILHALQEAQPGTPVVELGSMQNALSSIDRSALDIDAVKLLGTKFGIGAVITGKLEVEKVKPAVNITSLITSMSVSAYVEATLSAKLVETKAGATVWSNAAQGRENVASVSLMGGDTYFDAKDPEKAYGSLIKRLVRLMNDDFWAHWQ
jgi:hypothetical protein